MSSRSGARRGTGARLSRRIGGRSWIACVCAPLACAAIVLAAAGPHRALAAADDEGAPLRFRYRDGSSERIATRALEDAEYVSINDVSRLFAAVKHWDADTFQMELALEGGRARLTLGNPVVIINDEPILTGVIQMFDGVLWVPLDLVTQHLARLDSKRVAWVEPFRELRVAGARANVDRVRVEQNATGARVRVAITEPLSASATIEGRLLTVAWREAILPLDPLPLDDPSRAVDSMTVVARDNGAELRLFLADEFGDLFIVAGEAPPATVVRVVARADTKSAPEGADERGDHDTERWMGRPTVSEPAVSTIVIDPGHGGLDTGVVGRGGLREKDAALELAQALSSRLESRIGARVILTREDDESVRPERRATIANTSDADLFVSLHCNAASDLEAGGFEAYIYRSEEKPPPQRTAAARESVEGGGAPEQDAGGARASDGELVLLPWGFVQAPYVEQSRRLAEMLCKSVEGVGGLANRGVRSGCVLELAGLRMPAVHAEIGFLTNPDDEARLSSDEFRAKLVDALARGIEAFVSGGDSDQASVPREPEEQAARGGANEPRISAAAGRR